MEELFTSEVLRQIEEAIRTAETITAAEIRVHIDQSCTDDVLDHAAYVFAELGMHRTAQRNGILIYLTSDDRRLAVIGDLGVNRKVAAGFWDEVKHAMLPALKENNLAEGIISGIRFCAEALRTYYPPQVGDTNELSNEVTFGRTSR